MIVEYTLDTLLVLTPISFLPLLYMYVVISVYFIYRVIIGVPYVGLLNAVSLFIIMGVGVDGTILSLLPILSIHFILSFSNLLC